MTDRKRSSGPRPTARANLSDKEQRQRKGERRRVTGLVEIPGPLDADAVHEIRNIAASVAARDKRRRPDDDIVAITPFQGGLAIETSGEKLAQHIADALERSRGARVERSFDDEGGRRILACRLPR